MAGNMLMTKQSRDRYGDSEHKISPYHRTWVGQTNPDADFEGVESKQLDRERLQRMTEKDRKALIVKRANFCYHVHPPPNTLSKAANDAMMTKLNDILMQIGSSRLLERVIECAAKENAHINIASSLLERVVTIIAEENVLIHTNLFLLNEVVKAVKTVGRAIENEILSEDSTSNLLRDVVVAAAEGKAHNCTASSFLRSVISSYKATKKADFVASEEKDPVAVEEEKKVVRKAMSLLNEVVENAAKERQQGKTGTDRPLKMPFGLLNVRFPKGDFDKMQIDVQYGQQFGAWPSLDGLRTGFSRSDGEKINSFDENIKEFNNSELCKRHDVLVRELCEEKKFNKIVAFGIGSIFSFSRWNTPVAHWQHASLLRIRQIWEDIHKGEKLQIYLTDPSYLEACETIAKEHDMTILNGDFGHQMSWLEIDDRTLVRNFACNFDIAGLVLEYTRPAAIMESNMITRPGADIELEFQMERLTSLTIPHPVGDIEVPRLGVTRPRMKSFTEEYDIKLMDVRGLLCGKKRETVDLSRPIDPNDILHPDGSGGYSYLGGAPSLYTRKPGVQL